MLSVMFSVFCPICIKGRQASEVTNMEEYVGGQLFKWSSVIINSIVLYWNNGMRKEDEWSSNKRRIVRARICVTLHDQLFATVLLTRTLPRQNIATLLKKSLTVPGVGFVAVPIQRT